MKLQVIGEINKVDDRLYEAAVPELKRGQRVTVRLLNGTLNVQTKELMFGGVRTINLRDYIFDPYKKQMVEIGIPEETKEGKVIRFKKFILDGNGPGGLVGEYFELAQGNVLHEQVYTFLCLCNETLSNKNRDNAIVAKYEIVDTGKELRSKVAKRNNLRDALNMHATMKGADIVRFAAAMNWEVSLDPETLSDRVAGYAQQFPDDFLAKVKNPAEEMKATIKLAMNKGIIFYDPVGMKFTWAESGAIIAKLQKEAGKDELQLMAEWVFHAKNGTEVYDAIKSQYDTVMKNELGGGEEVVPDPPAPPVVVPPVPPVPPAAPAAPGNKPGSGKGGNKKGTAVTPPAPVEEQKAEEPGSQKVEEIEEVEENDGSSDGDLPL